MDLKELMNKGIDVGALYTKVSDLTNLSSEIQAKEETLIEIEDSIRGLLGEDHVGPIDLLNGTTLIIEDDFMYLEVNNNV